MLIRRRARKEKQTMDNNNGSFTIRRIYRIHKTENPDSMLSEKGIRAAVKDGSLPSLRVGNRVLIAWQTFEKWRSGELTNGQH